MKTEFINKSTCLHRRPSHTLAEVTEGRPHPQGKESPYEEQLPQHIGNRAGEAPGATPPNITVTQVCDNSKATKPKQSTLPIKNKSNINKASIRSLELLGL